MDKMPKEVPSAILLAVYRAEKLTMTELYAKTKFSTITILNHVNGLIKAGILEEEREGTFPKRRLIKVSKEGIRIASLLNLADASGFMISDIIEMGAKAGRMSAYQEALGSLRVASATRETLMAEILLKGTSAMAASLATLAKGLPPDLGKKTEEVRAWGVRFEGKYAEGQKRLAMGDANGSIAIATKALVEYSNAAPLMKDLIKDLKERRFEDLIVIAEFLTPTDTQKG